MPRITKENGKVVFVNNEKFHPDPEKQRLAETAADRWENAEMLGMPKLCRVEIPMHSQYHMRLIAEELRELATRLHIASQDTRTDPRVLRISLTSEIRQVNRHIKIITTSSASD